jgi:hypothetical protein
MSQAASKVGTVELDLSDVRRRVGQDVGGGKLIEPCSATDIRRWVMAMDSKDPGWVEGFGFDTFPCSAYSRSVCSARRNRRSASLPGVVRGEDNVCFAVTEPNVGAQHDGAQNPRGRRLLGQRREDLVLHRASRQQDAAPCAHHAAIR